MEDQAEHAPSGKSELPSRVPTQSMDDFMKETEPMDPGRDGAGTPRRSDQPPTKKQKKTVDTDVLAAEEEAVKSMGDTNWIGKLNGVYKSNMK
jgi:hypothetical protein